MLSPCAGCVAAGVVVGKLGGASFVQHAPSGRLREVLTRATEMLGDQMAACVVEPSLAEAALDRLRGGGDADSGNGARSARSAVDTLESAEARTKRRSTGGDEEAGASAKRNKGAASKGACSSSSAKDTLLALLAHPLMITLTSEATRGTCCSLFATSRATREYVSLTRSFALLPPRAVSLAQWR